MAAILAKKLGMTQLFLEDGRVERVTVLEAGPCPVTAIRTFDRDGYEAVQLAFGATKEKHLSKGELGHLRKADAPPMKHVVEFRDEAGELTVGETVTVEAFEPGQKVKISGVSKGKGFQGTVKRHNFARGPVTHGSHNVRAPGSIGAAAYAARGRARSAPRTSPAAASSSARRRATTRSRSTARSAAPRCGACSPCTPSATRSRSS